MEDNNKMDLRKIGCEGSYWIELAYDTSNSKLPMNIVMKLWIQQKQEMPSLLE
jgi:hypothetical protein